MQDLHSTLCSIGTVAAVDRRYRPRLADVLLDELLPELPALMLVGPRACGKTTTAARHARTVVRLDREAEAASFRADPDAALRGLDEPVLLDEWQAVPGVLGAVKRSVDQDPRPGRYLLAGSARDPLDTQMWPGTGRLVSIPMYGMTERERSGDLSSAPFLDRMVSDGSQTLAELRDPPDLRSYVAKALVSGFPEPMLNLSERARRRWLDSYIERLLTRDVEELAGARDPEWLRRYFEAVAANTAGVVQQSSL